MSKLLGCLYEQMGEENIVNRLRSAGWDDARINAADDIDVEAAIRGELATREVALYRSKLNALAMSELNEELDKVLADFDAEPPTDTFGRKLTGEKLAKARADTAARWLAGLLTPDEYRKGLNAKPSVDQLRGGYLNLGFAALTDLTEAIKPNTMLPGFMRDRSMRDTNRQIAKYLHGDKTAVDADMAGMLDGWLEVADTLRKRANALGADIPKLEGWGLRHSWSATKVSQVTQQDFVDDLVGSGVLDPQRMAGPGNPPLSEGQLRVAVAEIYESITTRGGAHRKPKPVDIPGIIANRHGEERQLHFKDGASWFDVAEKYAEGRADDVVLRSMYHYLEDMSGDIAIMERLGPSAAQNLRYMVDKVDILAGSHAGMSLDNTLNTFRSMARQDRSVQGWLASVGAAFRSYEVATKLPLATLTSLSDFGFSAVSTKTYGGSVTRMMGNYVKLMAGMSPKELQAMGLTADFLSRTLNRTTRYGDKFGAGAMGSLADFTMKASLLERHTLLGQLAFQMEINRVLGTHADGKLADLPDEWQKFFRHYGLNEGDWNALKATKNEHGLLDPTKIEDHMQSARVLGAFQQEVRYAFFEPNARDRTRLTFGSKAGTAGGELIRSIMMFKSFPLGVMTLHWGRIAGLNGPMNKLAYAGSLVALTTMLGAASITAKELAKGRTVPKFEDNEGKFLLDAFVQGGSGGLLLDIIAREARTPAERVASLAGPVVSDLAAAVGQMQKLATLPWSDDPTKGAQQLQSDLQETVLKTVPGVELWWMRALIMNQAKDQLNSMIDPMYNEKRAGLEGFLKQRGQELTY